MDADCVRGGGQTSQTTRGFQLAMMEKFFRYARLFFFFSSLSPTGKFFGFGLSAALSIFKANFSLFMRFTARLSVIAGRTRFDAPNITPRLSFDHLRDEISLTFRAQLEISLLHF
jgi:hypothetical protein